MENLGGTLRTAHENKVRKVVEEVKRQKVLIFYFDGPASCDATRLGAKGRRGNGLLIAVQKVQASTMGIMGLSQNRSGNSQENLEGVFYPLAYKRENNNNNKKKSSPGLTGAYVWPSFVKVSNGSVSCIIEGPCGDGIV